MQNCQMPTPTTTAAVARQKTRKCCGILIAPQEGNMDTKRGKTN